MKIRDWPALKDAQGSSFTFEWQWAIHGKPRGFGRDFGLVATSNRFQGKGSEIEKRFTIADQREGRFGLWWRSGRYY